MITVLNGPKHEEHTSSILIEMPDRIDLIKTYQLGNTGLKVMFNQRTNRGTINGKVIADRLWFHCSLQRLPDGKAIIRYS